MFMDFTVGSKPVGRVIFELFADVTPRTAENFRQYCCGEPRDEHGSAMGYKGAPVHRSIRGFMLQGGDFVEGDGTGCVSIYGAKFDDEGFDATHSDAGLLSMANSGANSNGCQFFITLGAAVRACGSSSLCSCLSLSAVAGANRMGLTRQPPGLARRQARGVRARAAGHARGAAAGGRAHGGGQQAQGAYSVRRVGRDVSPLSRRSQQV